MANGNWQMWHSPRGWIWPTPTVTLSSMALRVKQPNSERECMLKIPVKWSEERERWRWSSKKDWHLKLTGSSWGLEYEKYLKQSCSEVLTPSKVQESRESKRERERDGDGERRRRKTFRIKFYLFCKRITWLANTFLISTLWTLGTHSELSESEATIYLKSWT